MKQSKGLNGDMKPAHKKSSNRATMGPTTDIDSQAQNKFEVNFGIACLDIHQFCNTLG